MLALVAVVTLFTLTGTVRVDSVDVQVAQKAHPRFRTAGLKHAGHVGAVWEYMNVSRLSVIDIGRRGLCCSLDFDFDP